jgi:hypothetical protein
MSMPIDLRAAIEHHRDQKAVGALAQRHEGALEAMGGAALRVVDKMPENTLYLG